MSSQTLNLPCKQLLGVTLLIAGAMLSGGAWAHAHLKSQSPAADSSVTAPAELRLEFTEGVEAGFSQVTVSDASGAAVALQPVATAANDKKILLVRPTQPLAPGDYTVMWKVVSVDTHKSAGSYRFKVGQ